MKNWRITTTRYRGHLDRINNVILTVVGLQALNDQLSDRTLSLTRLTPWCQVVSAPPVSTSLDQECVEDFGRFLPVERLSRTVIEPVGDGVKLGLCVA
jgi:hypothetical protein